MATLCRSKFVEVDLLSRGRTGIPSLKSSFLSLSAFERRYSGQDACSSGSEEESLHQHSANLKDLCKMKRKNWTRSSLHKSLSRSIADLRGLDNTSMPRRPVFRKRGITRAVVEDFNVNVQSRDPTDRSQGVSTSSLENDQDSSYAVDNSYVIDQSPYAMDNGYGLLGGTHSSVESVQLLAASQMGAQVLAAIQYEPRWVWFARSEEEERQVLDRVINGGIVGFVAAATLAKVFTIDHDYWAGWTLVEIMRNAPGHNWSAYEGMLRTNPVFAKMCISGVVYSLGDWSAQYMEGRALLDFDRGRMVRSGLVGFCLHGSLSHYYYQFCEWLFPFKGLWVVPVKVAFDQTVWSAVWNSIYYVTLGLLRLEKPSNIWKELKSTFVPLLTAGWKLWPLAHIVTYGVVPVEQRLLWVDMVELVWVTILSMISNEKAEERRIEEEEIELAMENEFAKGAALMVESEEFNLMAKAIPWTGASQVEDVEEGRREEAKSS